MDAKARIAAAEAIEAELLEHLEAVRAWHRSQPALDREAHAADVNGVLWLFDALRDWREGVAETLQ
jgi:hypothetical protein